MKKQVWNDRVNGYFRSFLRRVFRWSPAYKACRDASLHHTESRQVYNAKKGKYVTKVLEFHTCAKCSGVFARKETQVDHKIPFVSPEHGQTESWDQMRARMSMENPGNLWVLCRKVCHQTKTNTENKVRRVK